MRFNDIHPQIERDRFWLKKRLEHIDLREAHANQIRSLIYHPWQRWKRTFVMTGFFNLLFGPTFFSILAHYNIAAAIKGEQFIGETCLAFMPLINTVLVPALVGFLEMILYKCKKATVMPEPNAHDTVPFIIVFPGLEKISHKIIGESLTLTQKQAANLLILGCLVQMVQASMHTHDPNEITFLDILYHDPLFTFLGQYFIFGKLLPKLYELLPDVIIRPIKNKIETVSNKINNFGLHLFDCVSHSKRSKDIESLEEFGLHYF